MPAKLAQARWDARIAEIATTQHGVVSRAQLLAIGLTCHRIDERLRSGHLRRLHRGVYAIGGTTLDFRARWLAAVLACGNRAVLSHRSAAALWGLRPSSSARVEVSAPRSAARRSQPGLVVHRPSQLSASDVTVLDAIPVTTPARTLLDLAAVVPRDELERALERAEQLELFDLRLLEAVLRRGAGRPGSAALRALLRDRVEPAFVRSELERRFLGLCREAGLPSPVVNVPVEGYEVDFHWPPHRLVVETGGRRAHATRAAFERDRERDAVLTAQGWRVVRFSYRHVVAHPRRTVALLRRLLAQPERSISSMR